MIADAEKYKSQDEELAKKVELKTALEEAIYECNALAKEKKDTKGEDEIAQMMDWLELDSDSATVEELKDVLRETLENRGALGNVRAHLRAEVSNALEDRTGLKRPDISNENLIINELIREYLVFNRYRSTLSVMLPESGQPDTPPFDRDFLARELRVRENDNSRKLPLLYTMLSNAQANK